MVDESVGILVPRVGDSAGGFGWRRFDLNPLHFAPFAVERAI
jgi:hypothetical protein